MKECPTLETIRLILRPFTLGDARDVQRLAGGREVAATTLHVPHPYVDGMAEQWIGTHQEQYERGELVTFAIVRRARPHPPPVGQAGVKASMKETQCKSGSLLWALAKMDSPA
jgi:RimJ/RimL family protein N-acetyltransferase